MRAYQTDEEMFRAIVARLDDPEWLRLRRRLRTTAVLTFLVGALAVAALTGTGWLGLGAFSATFLPGIAFVAHILHVRFRRGLQLLS